MIGILAAALTSASVAGLDYTITPLLVTLATRSGIVTPPGSLDWLGSPEAIGGAAALYLFGALSSRLGRPRSVKLVERSIGLPFAAASVLAVSLGAASRAGLDGHLLGAEAEAANWLAMSEYASADAAAIAATAVVAVPMAMMGKLLRNVIRPIPGAKVVQTTIASAGVAASAIVARLPGEVQVALAIAAVGLVALLAFGIVRRTATLVRWWREESQVSALQRVAVSAELLFPGSGSVLMRQPWSGAGRLAAALILLIVFVFAGPLALPLYLYIGLGGAIRVSRIDPDLDHEAVDATWDEIDALAPSQPIALGSAGDDW